LYRLSSPLSCSRRPPALHSFPTRRSSDLTPYSTDEDLQGGIRPVKIVVSPNGGTFGVRVTVDNDPLADEIQTEADVPNPTIKEIEVRVRLEHPSPGWQAAVPATIVMRRVRSN